MQRYRYVVYFFRGQLEKFLVLWEFYPLDMRRTLNVPNLYVQIFLGSFHGSCFLSDFLGELFYGHVVLPELLPTVVLVKYP